MLTFQSEAAYLPTSLSLPGTILQLVRQAVEIWFRCVNQIKSSPVRQFESDPANLCSYVKLVNFERFMEKSLPCQLIMHHSMRLAIDGGAGHVDQHRKRIVT